MRRIPPRPECLSPHYLIVRLRTQTLEKGCLDSNFGSTTYQEFWLWEMTHVFCASVSPSVTRGKESFPPHVFAISKAGSTGLAPSKSLYVLSWLLDTLGCSLRPRLQRDRSPFDIPHLAAQFLKYTSGGRRQESWLGPGASIACWEVQSPQIKHCWHG